MARHREFDEARIHADLVQAQRKLHDFDIRLQDVVIRISNNRQLLLTLERRSNFSLDPRYWFSQERADYRRNFNHTVKKVAELESVERWWRSSADELSQDIVLKGKELEAHRLVDSKILDLHAERKYVENVTMSLTSQRDQLRASYGKVEEVLVPPRAEYKSKVQRLELLNDEVTDALNFQGQLEVALNRYEKRLIHKKCEERFSEGSPSRVISKFQREIQSIERNLEKLKQRIEHVVKLAMRVTEKLVFDGNNLCYQGRDFCGLGPLKAAVQHLSGKFHILIIFDASIRLKLRLNDRDIANSFGGSAAVHVVATKKKADETVLDSALDSKTYVVSNDRFGDFPEKKPVLEGRLITHEIVDGRIFIHDLGVNERF